MSTLLVRGLSEEGPGDIVGAFVNEAGVGPDAIGEIEMDDTEATVEVESDADTVTAADVYADFVEYARETGRYVAVQ